MAYYVPVKGKAMSINSKWVKIRVWKVDTQALLRMDSNDPGIALTAGSMLLREQFKIQVCR
jgi:hypothetical protein